MVEPRAIRASLKALLALLLFAACGPEPPRVRNVVLVVVDTLRADRLGCYDYERDNSPAIDALALSGTLYERNRSQGCWTVPSMISLMSGLYVTQNETVLPPGYPSLGETLQAAGYPTAAFIGNRVLHTDRGFQRGYDHWYLGFPVGRAIALEREFEKWYKAQKAELAAGPGFFAWIHPMDPHHPYAPARRFQVYREPRPDYDELLPRWRAEQPRVAELAAGRSHPAFGEAVRSMNELSNLYDGEVVAVDEAVQRLMEFLERQGLLEETLVIFASDHGEMLWEHPHYPLELSAKLAREEGLSGGLQDLFAQGHRAWFHEELWNTPLILAGPGVAAGERSQALACNLDIYPTVLEALDVAPAGELHGQSLWGGREPQREQVFGFGFDTSAVYEAGGLKLIELEQRRFLLEEDAERPVELFDCASEPDETRNLAELRPAEVERLRADLRAWRERYEREALTETSDEAQKALQDLGYVDGAEDDEG